jgi:uncharacterized zinc-type alcohol dehydrogenase-like protein
MAAVLRSAGVRRQLPYRRRGDEAAQVPAFTLIGGDRSISGSATGNPSELRKLMKFAGRSKVAPTTELFPMSQINEALKHVREGKARYRVVLKADF